MITGMREGFINGPIVSVKTDSRVVLTQRRSKGYRVLTWFFGIMALVMIPIIIKSFKGPSITTLSCDRGTNRCELSGDTNHQEILSDIATAEATQSGYRDGDMTVCVSFIFANGKKKNESAWCPYQPASRKSYIAAVDAFNAFLANKSQAKFETSWSYEEEWWEKWRGVMLGVLTVFWVARLMRGWRTQTITFDKETKLVTSTTKPLRGKLIVDPDSIPLAQFASFKAIPGSIVEATRADGTKTKFLFPKTPDKATELAADLESVIAS